jgi:hypothetical protein
MLDASAKSSECVYLLSIEVHGCNRIVEVEPFLERILGSDTGLRNAGCLHCGVRSLERRCVLEEKWYYDEFGLRY